MKLKTIFLAFLASCLCLSSKEGKPNILLIFTDDLGYRDLACYGGRKVQTPEIDRLAKEGMLFNLSTDLAEKYNVAAQHPGIVADLLKVAGRVRKELGDVNVVGSDQRIPKLANPQEKR